MGQTTEAQDLLDRLRAGDGSARDSLIALAQARFVALARAMLRRYPHVRRWEQTDDLLQAALMRLHRSLARCAISGFHRRCNGFDHDTSPVVVFIDLFDETFVPPDSFNLRGSIEDQLK